MALKILVELDLEGQALRRFTLECQAMGRLSWHPHMVVVHDAGETPSRHAYLAMEYLPRGSLAERVAQRGPLAWTQVASIGVQVAGALEAAHREGLLHRDLKPHNLLIGHFGEAKLSDFGIAAAVESGTTSGDQGGFQATIAHAAPEVLVGASAGVTADVYSLGSALATLVLGHPPFTRAPNTPLTTYIAQIAHDPVPDLRRRGVPPELAALIEQAMAKDPNRRPPTAEALGQALRAAQRALGHQMTDLVIRAVPAGDLDDDPEATIRYERLPIPGGLDQDAAALGADASGPVGDPTVIYPDLPDAPRAGSDAAIEEPALGLRREPPDDTPSNSAHAPSSLRLVVEPDPPEPEPAAPHGSDISVKLVGPGMPTGETEIVTARTPRTTTPAEARALAPSRAAAMPGGPAARQRPRWFVTAAVALLAIAAFVGIVVAVAAVASGG